MLWIHLKYNADGRTFWISLRLCLQSLIITSLQYSSWNLNEKLNNAPYADQYGVHTVNTDVTCCVKCLQKWTYRAECGLCDVDSHFFPNISRYSLLNDCVTNREQMERNFTISNKNETVNLSRIFLKLMWNIIYACTWNFGARWS